MVLDGGLGGGKGRRRAQALSCERLTTVTQTTVNSCSILSPIMAGAASGSQHPGQCEVFL